MNSARALRETGFDPVTESQALRRRLLEATASPGRIVPLGDLDLELPPARLRPACALLLTVLDRETTFTVIGPDASLLGEYLRFNTNAALAPIDHAEFVLATAPWVVHHRLPPQHRRLPIGQPTMTVILVPERLSETSTATSDVSLAVLDRWNAVESRLHVSGLPTEDLDRLGPNPDGASSVAVWLAAADRHLAVLPCAPRWRREPRTLE